MAILLLRSPNIAEYISENVEITRVRMSVYVLKVLVIRVAANRANEIYPGRVEAESIGMLPNGTIAALESFVLEEVLLDMLSPELVAEAVVAEALLSSAGRRSLYHCLMTSSLHPNSSEDGPPPRKKRREM